VAFWKDNKSMKGKGDEGCAGRMPLRPVEYDSLKCNPTPRCICRLVSADYFNQRWVSARRFPVLAGFRDLYRGVDFYWRRYCD
jgi:hypothetical protein